ncbi:MAG: hypothetical protein CVV24_09325 [Ignavibacteriae bacterium HGW-Ignavibacteriae-3]|nr:MAG: hypothetical protein CVV24_09325 [Ignavibacteriae bacterium HGW-Ignavibacteriae-3]
MIRFLRSAFMALSFALIFISCNQDPSSVGSNLIAEQDKFSFQEFDSQQLEVKQSSAYYSYKPKLGISEYVLVGKTPYAESSLMLRYVFTLPDSTLTRFSNGEITVKDAWIEMVPRYSYGDKNAPFDFTVHQVRSSWTAPGFDRDSIPNLVYDSRNVKTNIAITDTTLRFHLNPDVVKEWIRAKYNTSEPKNNGLLLKATSNTQKMLGFLAVQAGSSYYDTFINFVLERPSYYVDTLKVPPDEDIHFITSSLPPAGNNFFLQGGYSLRSNIYFDLSAIPKNSIINKAIMELTVDPAYDDDGSFKSDSLFVQVLSDSTTKALADSGAYAIFSRSNNIFSGDITWAAQRWVTGSDNQGLIMSFYDEYYSAARIGFFGSKNSNKGLRPKLKIIYMQKK